MSSQICNSDPFKCNEAIFCELFEKGQTATRWIRCNKMEKEHYVTDGVLGALCLNNVDDWYKTYLEGEAIGESRNGE